MSVAKAPTRLCDTRHAPRATRPRATRHAPRATRHAPTARVSFDIATVPAHRAHYAPPFVWTLLLLAPSRLCLIASTTRSSVSSTPAASASAALCSCG